MRYLIHSGPGIGDVMQFLSMAKAIKDADKTAIVDLIMRGSVDYYKIDSQILECQSYIDNLYWYAKSSIFHSITTLLKLRYNSYDYAFLRVGTVTGEPSLWLYRIMRLAGCKNIVGFGTDKVDIKVELPERAHFLTRNNKLLEAIGIKGVDNSLGIDKNKLDYHWLAKQNIPRGQKIVALSLGTNSMVWYEKGNSIVYDVKSWSYKKWCALAELLSKEGYFVILLGGSKEFNELIDQKIVFPDNKNIKNYVGVTNIKQSLSLLSVCNLIVGAEGGMMHSAAAIGVKTLTIFGGSDYRMWNPGGADCDIVSLNVDCAPCFCTSKAAHCKEHRCLDDISVDMVLNKIYRLRFDF